jgi:hypothetical protein
MMSTSEGKFASYMLDQCLRSSTDISDGSYSLRRHYDYVRACGVKRMDGGAAHNDPTQNITIKLNLFPNPIFSAETHGTGSTRINRSSKMLNAAPI